jgi:THAP4-like, heme-binding beta-barrel domain
VTFTIPDGLHSDLYPLAWLVGTWDGRGSSAYPGEEPLDFGQQITFAADDRPFLSYAARSWVLDADGEVVRPLHVEYGFWRADGDGVSVVLAQPNGQAEVWVGDIATAKIEIATDAVVRTLSADNPYTAGHRLYGLVDSQLLWAFDKATDSQPMSSFAWARLERQ